ncbi:guanylate cyclase 32E-like, partial [Limulus polyphemus]|uniref:Guanylate cyclase 32E-like n=1 Tax=Limulus polyphemus TaxID=6850 RepID=A0ABM1T8P0_LIMPO
KCSDRKVSEKRIYPTFARTFPPSSKQSKSVISLLKHFEWTKVILVVSKKPSDVQMEEALNGLAREHGITVTETHYIPGHYLTKHNETVKQIILQTYKKTRVYVLLADNHPMVDFTRYMYEKGLLKNGEYVIICVDDEVYDPSKERQYIYKESEAADSDVLPFRAVFIVTHRAAINPEYEDFKQNVTSLSMCPPFVIPAHPHLALPVPLYAGLAYDAVMIYAKALTEALNNHLTEYDGKDIIDNIRGHEYHKNRGIMAYGKVGNWLDSEQKVGQVILLPGV